MLTIRAPLYFRTTDEMLEEFSIWAKIKHLKSLLKIPIPLLDKCDFVRPIKEGTFAPEIEGWWKAAEVCRG